jgi:hypothetical protein
VIPPADPRRLELTALVERVVFSTPVLDIHTHLYDPAFGSLLLWGIDDQLVYHLPRRRGVSLPPAALRGVLELSRIEQADLVWRCIFGALADLRAARGVITS